MPAPLARRTPTDVEPIEQLVESARHHIAEGKAKSTRRAYRSSFAGFDGRCTSRGLVSCPAAPATIAVYLAALAEPAPRSRRSNARLPGSRTSIARAGAYGPGAATVPSHDSSHDSAHKSPPGATERMRHGSRKCGISLIGPPLADAAESL